MALAETIEQITANATMTRNRVELLLAKLEGTSDAKVLDAALRTPQHELPHHVITKALRKEYGNGVVSDKSVGDWRRANLTELTGL